MRTYEVTVKVPPVWARESSKWRIYKVDAGGRSTAASKSISIFIRDFKPKDLRGRIMHLTIVRVN